MENDKPVLHLLVVGFHHKKGCQVEFSYPPLSLDKPNDTNECPAGWKYLPTLALPDGSHNLTKHSIFFNLPSLTNPNGTVYGVSCYRQIPVEKLKIRTADVTRSTVQKAVCALISIPLYGYIEVKLSLIAQAFFDQGDFSNTDIIVSAYDQLNACLCDGFVGISPIQHIHVGLPIRDIILKWRYKSLILFKLMLLQKRVVCFGSPVRPICSLILSILSLHPKLLENGFAQVACVRTSRPMSPMPDFPGPSVDEKDEKENADNLEDGLAPENPALNIERKISITEQDPKPQDFSEKQQLERNTLPRDASVDTLASCLLPLCSIEPSTWGAPIQLFTDGILCLPYLSLPYMDLLTDPSVTGYIIGTSNILFRQKRQLMDVLIDVEMATIETQDPEVRRQLSLSTEDLRFVDFIIRHVQTPKEDAEGSENWIREQFQGYMLAMLRTAYLTTDGSKEHEHYNGAYMMAWKKTKCYDQWLNANKVNNYDFESIPSGQGHPFAGTLSVGDMKLKIAQTMSNSESGRKLNQAVNTTSKAVGGALSQAKGAFSNWWSSITTPPIIASTPPAYPNHQNNEKKTTNPNIDQECNGNDDENTNDDFHKNVEALTDRNVVEENTVVQFVDRICSKDPESNINKDGIVEIAKEADILDSSR